MIDRTELDLRFDAHARMARAMNGHGWPETVVLPTARPRVALAALFVALAARLVPARPAPPRPHAADAYAAAPGLR